MQIHDPASDGQAEAAPAVSCRTSRVGPVEALEHALRLILGDARAIVDHFKGHPSVPSARLDTNTPSSRRMPDRIGNEIGENLTEPLLVAVDGKRLRLDQGLNTNIS